MKFKLFFCFLVFVFFISCSNINYNNKTSKQTYFSSGFAYIYNENDYKNKITNKKFDNNNLEIGHYNLRPGTLIKIINTENKEFVILKNNKRAKFPDFYQILITESVANKLKLNPDIPLVEIQEIKKNKSFVASKAKTFSEEKQVHSKAPVTSVKIDNISKIKIQKKTKNKKFQIKIGDFYYKESAAAVRKNLIKEINSLNNKKISIIKTKKNNFALVLGVYNTVNSLKNDYINLKNYGFEELEIQFKK